jgi:pimeloyl-ACP methyl ester carboxylesterase
MDRNWELLAPWADSKLSVPALYIVGEKDLVLKSPLMAAVAEHIHHFVPTLKHKILLPGCGHWTQQERPDEVNAALIEFFRKWLSC